MIRIEDLKESDKGREVVYQSHPGADLEYGKIKTWNAHYIFVNYHGPRFRGIAATEGRYLDFCKF